MFKMSIKIWLPILLLVTVFASLFLGGFLGLLLMSALGTHKVQKTHWTAIVNNTEVPVPSNAVAETRDMLPFAAHLEDYQKKYLCNCVVDSDEQVKGGMGGGFAYGSQKVFHWRLPSQDDVPFSFRRVDQTLIRQRVINMMSHTTLDCNITINGYLSEDGKHYYLHLSHLGGNFANIDLDYYADYDPDTQRLTLHVRQKLYREPYKRYQFEFELQDNPAPSRIFYGEREIPSMFVPVKRD